jgi:hypothetical protein
MDNLVNVSILATVCNEYAKLLIKVRCAKAKYKH